MKMTKLTLKMINHIAALEVDKDKAYRYAQEGVEEGAWDSITDCFRYELALQKWCHAVDMFESVQGLEKNALFDFGTKLCTTYNEAVRAAYND